MPQLTTQNIEESCKNSTVESIDDGLDRIQINLNSTQNDIIKTTETKYSPAFSAYNDKDENSTVTMLDKAMLKQPSYSTADDTPMPKVNLSSQRKVEWPKVMTEAELRLKLQQTN